MIMKKKIGLVLLLIAVMAGTAFAQNYKEGDGYKYWTSVVDNTFRILRMQTKTQGYGVGYGIIMPSRAIVAGDPRIVTVVSVYTEEETKRKEEQYRRQRNDNKFTIKRWKVGDKATINEIINDSYNISEYNIVTGSGYFVEFGTWSPQDPWTKVTNRRFGVILPNSNVLVASNQAMNIVSGAVGWDDEFLAANNLEEFMQFLAEKVDYKWLTGMVDMLKAPFALAESKGLKNVCPMPPPYNCLLCKGDITEHIITSATAGAAGWGALWGLAPPWLLPAEFAKVQAQFTAQAYLAASIGYLHGKYKTGGAAFTRQLKIDNYVLFAGKDSDSISADAVLMNIGAGGRDAAVQEAVQEAAKFLATKLAPKFVDAIPVVGTVWGVTSGAWTGASEAQAMGRRAVKYYRGGFGDFTFEPNTGTITKYNGKDKAVIIPALIGIDKDKDKDDKDKKPVLIIGGTAFTNNKTIESVTLESVRTRTIEANAFAGCSSLKTISFPQDQAKMTIGANAFNGTKLNDADKRKLREFGYTGAGVGQAEPTYTVTFMVPNGSPIQRTADRNTTVTLPTTPTKQGSTFEGWNTQSDGKGAAFTASTKVTGNVTLYPKWKENAVQPPAQPVQPPAQPAKPAQPAQPTQPANKTYNIGDTGPGGGIVFAAGKECTSTDLGQVVWAEAANLAKSKGSGWRLPTKDELNAMYNNLQKNNKGNFRKESYWATNGNSAFAQNFSGGNTNDSPNSDKRWVRAVRSF